jgi:fructose-bisphosphate aldolase class I
MSNLPGSAADKFRDELRATANKIATPGKGILAADESTGTIASRFKDINLENTDENRRAYRELLFGLPGLSEFISGTILFDETLMVHRTKDGTKRLADLLLEQGILIGIKVDAGLKPLPGGLPGEVACSGLDGLAERCQKYYAAGARFSKWRAAYTIDPSAGKPSELVIKEQAWGLARYAAICQANGLCPIVEPEVMMDGTHDIETCARISEHVYSVVVQALHANGVFLEGCLLKPNMVTSGQAAKVQATSQEIAWYTIRTLKRTIPAAIPGITFLSGGQSEEEASQNLNTLNLLAGEQRCPWRLTFSYGRALQASTIKKWDGKLENVEAARAIFRERCKANSEASLGKYAGTGATGPRLFVEGYTY